MKQRIISAIIAIIILMPLVIYGKIPFYLGVSILGCIGFNELLNLKENKKKIPITMKIISLVAFIIIMMDGWGIKPGPLDFKSKLIFTIFFIILPIIFYEKERYTIEDAFYILSSILFLGLGFNTLAMLRIANLNYFIYLLLIVVITDTFAYFTGTFLGRHKMCPSISPKKTWEGFFGGLLMGTFVSTTIYCALFEIHPNILIITLISMILSIIGQLGDLVFSKMKRHFEVKDFGKIMPGHGGVLDRLDSLLFVLIAFGYLVRFL